jgi:hypothetical protein
MRESCVPVHIGTTDPQLYGFKYHLPMALPRQYGIQLIFGRDHPKQNHVLQLWTRDLVTATNHPLRRLNLPR